MRRAAIAWLGCALASGCTPDFDPSSLVDKLRLLSVRAEPPEAAPGESSTLDATAFAPASAPVAIHWDVCTLPPLAGSGQAISEDCVAPDTAWFLSPVGDGDHAQVTMPALLPTALGLPDATDGFYLPVRLRLRAGDAVLTAFYRLRYGLAALGLNPPNQNPTLTGIFWLPTADDPQPLAEAFEVHAKDVVVLRAPFADGSAETYQLLAGDPQQPMTRSVTETLRVSWFATAGSFSVRVTGVEQPDTELHLDEHLPASGTVIDLWAVARDERGGSDIAHRTLLLR